MTRDARVIRTAAVQRRARSAPRRLVHRPAVLLGVLLLSLTLGACATSVDTAATVGGDRITVGELNAATQQLRARLGEDRWRGNEEIARRYVLDQLVENRLQRLEAARNGTTISDADIATKREADITALAKRLRERDAQSRDTLAAGAVRQLRAAINARGGAALTDAELQPLVRAEVDRLAGTLATPTQTFPDAPSATAIEERSASLAGALAAKGAPVPAAEIVPTMTVVASQLAAGTPTLADSYQSQIMSSGFTSASDYRQGLQQQLLERRLEPLYTHPVNAISLQQLVTDSKAKAAEALVKARAGADFAALIQEYAIEAARNDQVVNGIGSVVPDSFPPEIRNLFPSLNTGDYSEVWTAPSQTGGQPNYRIFKIVKSETRAPTADELKDLRQQWLESLRKRYPVWENPALNLPPRGMQ